MKYSIFLLSIIFLSCNPIKKILNDKKRLDKIAEQVIKLGYCANDTIILTRSDTTIKYDTSYSKDTILEKLIINDTTYIKIKVPTTIKKTITIRDTIKNVVVDGSRLSICQKELTSATDKINKYKLIAKKRWWWIFILLFFIIGFVIHKPFIRFIKWQFLKS